MNFHLRNSKKTHFFVKRNESNVSLSPNVRLKLNSVLRVRKRNLLNRNHILLSKMKRCPEYRDNHDINFRKFHSITQDKLWSGAKLDGIWSEAKSVGIWNGTKLVYECVHLSRIEIKWLFPIKSSDYMEGNHINFETYSNTGASQVPWKISVAIRFDFNFSFHSRCFLLIKYLTL